MDKGKRTYRLLVIDDDENLLEVFQVAVSKLGFEVGQAKDGAEGLDMVESFRPDIILLDLMMPVMNGFVFVKKLKEKGRVDIPIVVMTGYWEEAHERELRQEPNISDYLRKPIKFAELAGLLRAIIERRKP